MYKFCFISIDFVVFGVSCASALSHFLNIFDSNPGSITRRILPLPIIVYLMQAFTYAVYGTNSTYSYCWEYNGHVRLVYPLRYFYWACSNPLILAACARLIGIPPRRIIVGTIVTMLSMLLGYGAELRPLYSPSWMVLFFFACLFGTYILFFGGKIMYAAQAQADLQWKMYIAKYQNMVGYEQIDYDYTTRVLIRSLIPLIGVVWNSFAVVYIISQTGVLTTQEELMILPLLDGISKILLCNVIVTLAKLYSKADAREQQAITNATLASHIYQSNAKGQQALLHTFASQLRLPLRSIHIASIKASQRVNTILEEDEGAHNMESHLEFVTGSASRPATPPLLAGDSNSASGNRVTFAADTTEKSTVRSSLPPDTKNIVINSKSGLSSASQIHYKLLQSGAIDALNTVKVQASILGRVIDDFIALHASTRRRRTTTSATSQSSVDGSTSNNFSPETSVLELERLNITNFIFSTVIDGSIMALQGTALRHGVTVLSGRSKAVPEQIFGDEARMRYLVMALLAKSLSLCHPGGRVEVRTSAVGFRRVPIKYFTQRSRTSSTAGNDSIPNSPKLMSGSVDYSTVVPETAFTIPVPFIRISVTDDGAGLDDQSVANMFRLPTTLVQPSTIRVNSMSKIVPENFSKLNEPDEDDDEHFHGESVNLKQYMNDTMYLCQSVAEALGGTVGVSSIKGTGTMIFADLPAFSSDPRLLITHHGNNGSIAKYSKTNTDSSYKSPIPLAKIAETRPLYRESQKSDGLFLSATTVHVDDAPGYDFSIEKSVVTVPNQIPENGSYDAAILNYAENRNAGTNRLLPADDPRHISNNTPVPSTSPATSTTKGKNPSPEEMLQAYTTLMEEKKKRKTPSSTTSTSSNLTDKEKQLGSLLIQLQVTNVR